MNKQDLEDLMKLIPSPGGISFTGGDPLSYIQDYISDIEDGYEEEGISDLYIELIDLLDEI